MLHQCNLRTHAPWIGVCKDYHIFSSSIDEVSVKIQLRDLCESNAVEIKGFSNRMAIHFNLTGAS